MILRPRRGKRRWQGQPAALLTAVLLAAAAAARGVQAFSAGPLKPHATFPPSTSSSTASPSALPPPLRTLLIDNYDSYTYNLAHYLAEINNGVAPTVLYNDAHHGDWTRLLAAYTPPSSSSSSSSFPFDNIVISPGPGSPDVPSDFGLSRAALELEVDVPVLGICLGHQGLGFLHGGTVRRAPKGPMHGRLSRITHTGEGLFANLPQDFAAVRYHSLVVDPPLLEGGRKGGKGEGWPLVETAWTTDGVLMGLQHKTRPHYGVQFHPESIGTQHGHALLRNFYRLTRERARARAGGREGGKATVGVYVDKNVPVTISSPPGTSTTPEAEQLSSSSPSPPSSTPQHQVLIRRLGRVPGVGRKKWKALSEALFVSLYAGQDTAFWLDSSATQVRDGAWGEGEEGREGGREEQEVGGSALVPPAMGGRFSYMGDAASGSALAHVVEYYLLSSSSSSLPPSSSFSSSLLRVVRGEDGQVVREERGSTLFTHLQDATRAFREGGIAFSFLGEDVEGGKEGGKEGGVPQGLPEFWGGYVGYFGYELKDDCLRLQRGEEEEEEGRREEGREGGAVAGVKTTPDAVFVFADRLLAFDHVEGTLTLVAVVEKEGGTEGGGEVEAAEVWLQQIEAKVWALVKEQQAGHEEGKHHHGHPSDTLSPAAATASSSPRRSPLPAAGLTFRPLVSPPEYKQRVDQCLELIAAGESYEVCLTGQLAADLPPSLDPFYLYRRLRRKNPAPFSAYLRHDPLRRLRQAQDGQGGREGGVEGAGAVAAPAVAICCSSPERFLRVNRASRQVESKPIKGTVRRGHTAEEDVVLAAGLAACEKNRAENLMIVDLVRNDISRIACPGSVNVPRLMAVETYATVHQLVSTVTGVLAEGKDAIDAVVASFPGGSMTGAPKKRTMEIISRLEGGQERGPYSGALGYVAMDGLAADLNIVIRTAVCAPGLVTVGAGGAIVAMSDREKEYEEMVLKARAVEGALEGGGWEEGKDGRGSLEVEGRKEKEKEKEKAKEGVWLYR